MLYVGNKGKIDHMFHTSQDIKAEDIKATVIGALENWPAEIPEGYCKSRGSHLVFVSVLFISVIFVYVMFV